MNLYCYSTFDVGLKEKKKNILSQSRPWTRAYRTLWCQRKPPANTWGRKHCMCTGTCQVIHTVYIGNEWRVTPIIRGAVKDNTQHHSETTFEWKHLRPTKLCLKPLHARYICYKDTRLGVTTERYSLGCTVRTWRTQQPLQMDCRRPKTDKLFITQLSRQANLALKNSR